MVKLSSKVVIWNAIVDATQNMVQEDITMANSMDQRGKSALLRQSCIHEPKVVIEYGVLTYWLVVQYKIDTAAWVLILVNRHSCRIQGKSKSTEIPEHEREAGGLVCHVQGKDTLTKAVKSKVSNSDGLMSLRMILETK
ncbi:Hypothetical predicted protein [Octopus vulgaris]|uniref:Uncharacterized protein n=1 Tax=Octopus vulgaris TaxID=6645 RepID=A0AA36F0X7_OCTVU|nr:Hypothetical predicted protein [Octopus vulgaris]